MDWGWKDPGHKSATKTNTWWFTQGFQLWTMWKVNYPQSYSSASHENPHRGKAIYLSILWKSIHNRLSSHNTCSKSSQCDHKYRDKHFHINLWKLNVILILNCLTKQEANKVQDFLQLEGFPLNRQIYNSLRQQWKLMAI